jgi:hypothetical protein
MKSTRTFIETKGVKSLTWYGDQLVDWAGGITVFHLDGKIEPNRLFWGFDFDAVQATPNGRYAVLYKRLGTKALLLHNGKILRELNRSYYFAETYEYPVSIWNAPDGRTLIAHCPDEYNQIEIEDAETGQRLTSAVRKPDDFFHSRLMVNSNGTRLLSAGWIWHPFDGVTYFGVAEALQNPAHLDQRDSAAEKIGDLGMAEVGSACWQSADYILLGGVSDPAFPEVEKNRQADELSLRTKGLAIYDVAAKAYIKSFALTEPPGTMMPVGETYVACFYKHPKLVSLETGEIVAQWEDLDTGNQASSILSGVEIPPLALDAENNRFAVAGLDGIHVVQIDLHE